MQQPRLESKEAQAWGLAYESSISETGCPQEDSPMKKAMPHSNLTRGQQRHQWLQRTCACAAPTVPRLRNQFLEEEPSPKVT